VYSGASRTAERSPRRERIGIIENRQGADGIPAVTSFLAARDYGTNLLPVEHHSQLNHSPLLAYPYERTREALERLARHGPVHPVHGVKMRYANPIDGGFVFRTIAAFVQWLPEGFRGRTYRSTESAVFCVIEGNGAIRAGDENFAFEQDDVFVVPPWTRYGIDSAGECVLFSYSDRAAQVSLGFWREGHLNQALAG
jgi:gentisate 1,2-dioxygenase